MRHSGDHPEYEPEQWLHRDAFGVLVAHHSANHPSTGRPMNAPMPIAAPTRWLVLPLVTRISTRPATPTAIGAATVSRTVCGGSGWGPNSFVTTGSAIQKTPPNAAPA